MLLELFEVLHSYPTALNHASTKLDPKPLHRFWNPYNLLKSTFLMPENEPCTVLG